VLRIDPQKYLYPFIISWPTLSRTAETLLVRREGNDALFLNELRFQKNAALNLRIPLKDTQTPAVKAALGQAGIVEGIDYRGVPVIAYVRSVPDSPWFLVARMDISEVYTPLRERLWEIVILIGALLICAGAGTGFVWRHQRARFYREKYEVTETLRESEERFRLLVEGIKDYAIIMLDREGQIVSWNEGAQRIKGYKEEEIIGKNFSCFYPAEDIEKHKPERELKVAAEEGRFEDEGRRLRKDGSRFWANVIITALHDGQGRMVGFSKITRDLTERKQSEERIRKLNRTLAMLSDINQAIVRIREPQKLFEEACRIAIEKGNFSLAWIGLLDDSTQRIQPVASAGKSGGYLEKINISLKDAPRGYCPIDSALRKGEYVICNVIGQDEDLAPCQKIALELGFRSSVSFPLKILDSIRGTVNFYTDEPHFFDVEEIKLLDELAMDITFAMEFSEKETERKKAEEALRASEVQFRAMFEVASIGIAQADIRTGKWLRVNQKMCEITGYSADEMLRMRIPEITHPEDRQRDWEAFQRVVRGETQDYRLEKRYVRKDGSLVWVNVNMTVIRDADGQPMRTMATIEDITERKRMEEELKHNESRMIALLELNKMIDSTLQDITSFTLEEAIRLTESKIGYLAFLNEDETVMTMYSWSKTAMEECRISDKPIIYPVETTGLWGEAVRQRRPITTNDYQAPNPWKKSYPEGHVHITRHMNIPVFDGERIVLVAGVGNKPTDYNESDVNQLTLLMEGMWRIIQRRRAETEIKQLNAELEQRVIERTSQLEAVNKELEAFSYSVSHDLRAPIRHISGFVELLKQNTAQSLDEKNGRYLNIIAEATNHMGHLIDDILSFSRMGRAEMQKTLIKSDQLVKEAINQLQPEMEGRHVAWDIHSLPELYGDPPMLKLVWINLIGNALKYTRKQPNAKIEIAYNDDKDDHIFYISDNGAGFDMMYVHKLFNIFQRLHRAEEFEGTGVGLANVRRIIQRHGGRTWAEGKVGEGATFYFSLPKANKRTE
jgi:PAS domain S-box-containing protein